MRKLTLIAMLLGVFGLTTQAQAADKVRFAYAVQVHQANMMIIQDFAKKYGVELEIVPMRRYADLQCAHAIDDCLDRPCAPRSVQWTVRARFGD